MLDREIKYYHEICTIFSTYLKSYFDDSYTIYFEFDKTLDVIVDNFERATSIIVRGKNEYVPKLKVDIVFVIYSIDMKPKFVLIEVKYDRQLSLIDYSQLVGYIQVGKKAQFGLLLLVQKDYSTNKLSNDFREIINLRKLPMDWVVALNTPDEKHTYKTGILTYLPNNGIDWVDTNANSGISSFAELARLLSNPNQ